MLLFLNRTGFNGLFRLNRQGGFNVPAGRYVNPRICDPAHVHAVAEAFRRPGITIDLHGFDAALAECSRADFVYCDPPYEPLSRTASFASYTAGGFTMFDQRLNLSRQVADEAKEYFGSRVFDAVIPRNVRLAEAPSFGKPIVLYDILSIGAQSYLALANEIIAHAGTGSTTAGDSAPHEKVQ